MKKNAYMTVPERFMKPAEISKTKVDKAIEVALDKLEKNLSRWDSGFVCRDDNKNDNAYKETVNNNWMHGMNTGIYWLAYELSGNKKFRDMAEKQMPSYQYRWENKIGFEDHDVGFTYSPSCVAAYKRFGDEKLKKMLLDAADYYYNTSFSKKGNCILAGWTAQDTDWGCRTMMDALMNAPFLFWAGKEAGKPEYTNAALAQNKTTADLLIRDDGSSFHHYQLEIGTHKPVRGLTWQGYSDDSCWSRGHAWGVYGFAIAYSYVKEAFLTDIHKDVAYYMLNKLPEDLIPYWDYYFTEGDQPRDSSAGAISVCGLHEMAKQLPEDSPQKKIYESAAAQMLEALIDHCAGDQGFEYDGLLCHVTGACPQGLGIDGIALYGDYHYLEALMRFANPSWERYW